MAHHLAALVVHQSPAESVTAEVRRRVGLLTALAHEIRDVRRPHRPLGRLTEDRVAVPSTTSEL